MGPDRIRFSVVKDLVNIFMGSQHLSAGLRSLERFE